MAVDFLSKAKILFPSYAEFIHSDTLLYALPGPRVGCPSSTPYIATVVLMSMIASLALMGVFATVVLVSLQFHRHIASSQYWHATCSWHSVVCQCSFFLRYTFILFWVLGTLHSGERTRDFKSGLQEGTGCWGHTSFAYQLLHIASLPPCKANQFFFLNLNLSLVISHIDINVDNSETFILFYSHYIHFKYTQTKGIV